MIQGQRIRRLNARPQTPGRFVLYWMQASQRERCNHALEHAIRRANDLRLPLLAVFGLTGRYPQANLRHYSFLLEGLAATQSALARRGVPLLVRRESPDQAALDLTPPAALLVVDCGYTALQRAWRRRVAQLAPCPVEQVESDVVVPVEAASGKQQYSAATLRPRLLARLDEFLRPLQPTRLDRGMLDEAPAGLDLSDIPRLLAEMDLDRSVAPVAPARGGTDEALALFRRFLRDKLPRYADRSDPALDIQSRQSPYLHFGQVSPLDLALQVRSLRSRCRAAADAYIEQLVVRRELAANFLHYCPRYASFRALPSWARATLAAHCGDPRRPCYALADLEHARTHDPFWNAAQREMLLTGGMHNTLRMYWAKKILEWSPSPELAFRRALHLNNKYFLDGRGPNAFANVLWCFGLHDRPWPSRPIYGTVRSMAASGLARKYNMPAYLQAVETMAAANVSPERPGG